MSRLIHTRAWLALLLALLLTAAVAPATVSAADPSPGDELITLDVGDSYAGGEVLIQFQKVYAGTTDDGTDIYIYVPVGALGAETAEGVDPNWDPNPDDEFVPCGSQFDPGDYVMTQEQINLLGDQLKDQIVAVNVDHFGPIEPADPTDPESDALVVLAYNILDDFYYECGLDSFTAGFFAPGFIEEYGMNVIVIDAFDWANRVGEDLNDYAGVIGHELEHLQMNYSDSGELSWVDEGLADMAIFFNGWGDTNDSHLLYHQVLHRETSLTRWGGGLENYGAAYSYFLYLWEQAGGNGDGTLNPDLENDEAGGDLLIQYIFQEEADGMEGVQLAIDRYNAETGSDLRSAEDLFKDWAVAILLDDEASNRFDFANINFGDAITSGWTIELANDLFFDGRGIYNGNMPPSRWEHNKNVPAQTGLPFGVSYEFFRNPGPQFGFTFDGEDNSVVAPHTGGTHWYAGYESMNDNILNVDGPAITGGETVDFWTWYFIEEGWDFGYVEALVDGEWEQIDVVDDSGTEITTDVDDFGNNTEGNGITGTSGGTYFVDEPVYVHLQAVLPADATDVRFRYSTDAAYLDTGWFIDDVAVDGTTATLTSETGNWYETTGEQNNNWVIQIIAPCDLTPGVTSQGEIVDEAGYIYRFEGGDDYAASGFSTKCLTGKQRIAVVISNLPTGDLTFLDADYEFRLTNTGNRKGNN
ncbi:MAG TPA: hypothetical protein VEX62_05755 [Candidatus Limnocylindrales bacterium]|nr:hypothetical protein [Candidatus Limnocylindrales bacterium]